MTQLEQRIATDEAVTISNATSSAARKVGEIQKSVARTSTDLVAEAESNGRSDKEIGSAEFEGIRGISTAPKSTQNAIGADTLNELDSQARTISRDGYVSNCSASPRVVRNVKAQRN